MSVPPDPDENARPRVTGDREQEILDAAIEVLIESGYDRLTMDAVAAMAKASKATLYRRWNGKADLVIEALLSHKGAPTWPDTGTLRGDLRAAFCGMGGITDVRATALLGSVVTAISRDEEFASRYRTEFIGPKVTQSEEIYRRAMARGEIRDDLDLEVLAPALPGILLHRLFLLGDQPTEERILQVIDQIILPAATRDLDSTTHEVRPS